MKKLLIIAVMLGGMSFMANEVEPAVLSKCAWKYSMQHMHIRAGLTGKETRDVLAFILEAKTAEDAK